MYSFFEPLFWVNALYFIVSSILAFFIPGNIFIKKFKLTFFAEVVLSIIVGFVFWCLQGFLFGYMQLRFLTYLYLIISLVTWIFLYRKKIFERVKFKKPDFAILILLILGTLMQLSTIWPNGLSVNKGLYFCCGMPDTLYHLALTSELVKQFPPHEPGISGVLLQNYHYLSNLGVADLIRVFNLPIINTQYQYMTVLISFLFGLSILVLANLLNFTRTMKLWLLFLIFFYGDIIFLLSYLNGHGFNFLYTTLENSESLWISPPRFYAIVVFIAGLNLFVLWLKKKDLLTGIIMAIVFASLIGMKIYVGAIMLAGLGVLGIIFLFKKEFKMLVPIVIFYLISIAIFLPVNSNSGGLYFSGFWRFEDFIVQPSLGLVNLELARQIFAQHNNTLRVILYDLYFGFLYFVFSAGILILGLFQTRSSLKQIPGYFTFTLLAGLLATCAAGFFFLQKSGGANSGQFLISIYIIGVIYAAIAISWWLNKLPKKVAFILIFVLVIITSVRVVHDTFIRVARIASSTAPSVDSKTLDSYMFFANTKKDDTVLTYDEDNFGCLLIRVVGNSAAYACSLGAPGDRGVSIADRVAVRKIIFHGKDLNKSKEALIKNRIAYIYMPKSEVTASNVSKMNLPKVLDDNNIVIYKVLDFISK